MPTDRIKNEIDRIVREHGRAIIAVDGRCASGKTTFAEKLKAELHCNVIHMDDFFLRPEQRTRERYAEPGGNVDRERLEAEVLVPLAAGAPFSYRPFDCRKMALSAPVAFVPNDITLIEGTYSTHPVLTKYYDLRIFMTASHETQLSRLTERNPDCVDMFREKWIPLEEAYFSAFDVESKADIVIRT